MSRNCRNEICLIAVSLKKHTSVVQLHGTVCVCVCMRACMRVCECACMRVCMCANE